MVALLQDRRLLHHTFLLFLFVAEDFLLDALDGHEMVTNFMASKIYFAKGTSAKDATDSIEFTAALFHLVEFLEVEPDYFTELVGVTVVFFKLFFLGVFRGFANT